MTLTRKTVLTRLTKNVDRIRQFGVTRLGLFGSAARDQTTPASDLDFIVEFKKTTFHGYMDLLEFLEGLFHAKIDLAIAKSIKPRLKPRILKEVVYVPGL